jgi:hypothetical protein
VEGIKSFLKMKKQKTIDPQKFLASFCCNGLTFCLTTIKIWSGGLVEKE